MKKLRWLTLSGFALLAAMAFFTTRTEAQPAGQTHRPRRLVPRGRPGNLGHSNNIIIEMKDYLIVVDANFPSGARLAMETAQRISPKPVKYVFDTHHHGDHAYGNPIWTKAGATTLAYVGVAEEMKRFEPARWQAAAKERHDVADLQLTAPEPPQQTFDKSPFVLKDGSREVRFYFFGWAHTRGDGFVYLPKEQGALHRRCGGQRPVQLHRRRQCRQLAEGGSLGAGAGRALHVLPGHGELRADPKSSKARRSS